MGVKNDRLCFPGVSLLRIPEYFKETLSETHKLFKHYNVLLKKKIGLGPQPRTIVFVTSVLPKLKHKLVSEESKISDFCLFIPSYQILEHKGYGIMQNSTCLWLLRFILGFCKAQTATETAACIFSTVKELPFSHHSELKKPPVQISLYFCSSSQQLQQTSIPYGSVRVFSNFKSSIILK